MKEIDEKEFLTPRQAAQYLGLCYKTFYIYINKGVIKAWKLNRKTLVKRSDIEHSIRCDGTDNHCTRGNTNF